MYFVTTQLVTFEISTTVLLNVRSNISAKGSFHSSVQHLALVFIINMFSCLSAEDLKLSSLERITVTVDGDEGNDVELKSHFIEMIRSMADD